MSEERAVTVRRLFAFAVDCFVVVVLWGGVICGAMMIVTGGKPPQPGSPWAGQAIGFLTIAVPFTLYLYFPGECKCHAARLSSLSAMA